jgi:hypothetical protein
MATPRSRTRRLKQLPGEPEYAECYDCYVSRPTVLFQHREVEPPPTPPKPKPPEAEKQPRTSKTELLLKRREPLISQQEGRWAELTSPALLPESSSQARSPPIPIHLAPPRSTQRSPPPTWLASPHSQAGLRPLTSPIQQKQIQLSKSVSKGGGHFAVRIEKLTLWIKSHVPGSKKRVRKNEVKRNEKSRPTTAGFATAPETRATTSASPPVPPPTRTTPPARTPPRARLPTLPPPRLPPLAAGPFRYRCVPPNEGKCPPPFVSPQAPRKQQQRPTTTPAAVTKPTPAPASPWQKNSKGDYVSTGVQKPLTAEVAGVIESYAKAVATGQSHTALDLEPIPRRGEWINGYPWRNDLEDGEMKFLPDENGGVRGLG